MVRKPSNYKPYTPSHGLRGRGGFNVDVKLEGEWLKFGMLMSNLSPTISAAASGAQKAFAERYRDEVRKNIKQGGKKFGYGYTSADYKKQKARYGGGSTLLRWTDSFLNAVQVINQGMFKWQVGVPTGIQRNTTGVPGREQKMEVHEYANILEQGYPPFMPPRPIFADTFRDMGGKAFLAKFLSMSLVRRFSRMGIKVT